MSVLLTTLAALPSAIWECHDKHDFQTKDPRIKDQDLRFVGASIGDCQKACNASAANCSVISWHGGDLHCHIWQGSGLITHDDFMANISDACGHTVCIVSESALPPSPPPPPPTYVTTPSGRLRGFLDPAHEGLRAFRGIPYAKPPVGDLRWRPPRPFGTWEGTRDATQFGHTCIQQVGFAWETVEGVPTSSEDCLYLNVVAPAAAASAGVEDRAYPVVVYLHAGQFQYGAGSDCESDWPFADDIVYVTPNSRLGPFGFLGSDELRARAANGETGSYGLSDQRLALQWVRENIAAFGGDPSNVVIMGESSGGTSVAAHLVMSRSWGLFHKAIMESPGLTQVKSLADASLNYKYLRAAMLAAKSPNCTRDPWKKYEAFSGARLVRSPLGAAANESDAVAKCEADARCVGYTAVRVAAQNSTRLELYASAQIYMDLYRTDGSNATSYLKAAAADDGACLVQAEAKTITAYAEFVPRGDTFYTDAWAPVVDGVALPTSLVAAIAAGKVAPSVPLLAGSNMDEGTIFMYLTPKLKCSADADELSAWASAFYGAPLGAKVPGLYSQLRQPVPQCADKLPWQRDDPFMAAMRSAGDFAITCRVRAAAAAFDALKQPVFTYYFAHTPTFSENYRNIPTLGAVHGAEVPFVFGVAPELKTDGERALSRAMGCYWRNFVHRGDPNPGLFAESCVPRGAEMPRGDAPNVSWPWSSWPRFRAGREEATLVLDVDGIAVERGLKSEQCEAFKGY
jgi:carboxylesterase type B